MKYNWQCSEFKVRLFFMEIFIENCLEIKNLVDEFPWFPSNGS